ncbi:putative 1,2-alpha-mannosidase [Lophium mytilinum]|uniref:alpha-1,2-Mannosidase n=1 Tax=Lophium mytilinum TaxID=390894 RepID=A0A6A6RDX2_9PEZI|nr:putative 1,2-alpha-mannosidase [Lophium mytilinum]
MGWLKLAVVGALLPAAFAAPQRKIRQSYDDEAKRAQAVKDAFTFSWNGYKTYAFPHDELYPVSNKFGDSRNGWGASAVDALSTALVMELSDVVNEIIEYVPTIDFSKTSTEVSLFETTIRYLGGMLAGYDFLKGPLSGIAKNESNVDALLAQAKNLANVLSFAFDTPTGIPFNDLYLGNRSHIDSFQGLATTGTLILEWTRLSDLTGNQTYAELSQKAESYLLNPQPASSSPWPGLLGYSINVTTGQFQDDFGGWIGGADSYYEYLIKMFVYDPTRFKEYSTYWSTVADSTIAHLTTHPKTRPDITFVAEYNGKTLIESSQHLACFHGGNFLLGGTVLKEQKYINYGLDLVDGCRATYASTATGIGPEVFGWNASAVPTGQKDFFQKNGFYITTASYDLRPEVIESYYYAYRVTGDTKYQDWAWEAFLAINSTCAANSGYSAVENVNVVGGGAKLDFQESFWYAEVMKYAYLIHAPEAEWQVDGNGNNKWVFNTEAHPFKVVG